MAKKTRPQIKASIVAKFYTNVLKLIKGDTSQDQLTDIADSFVSIDTDANVNGGYLQIDNTGKIDVSFVKSAMPTGKFLKDDGTYAITGGISYSETTIDITGLTTIDLTGVAESFIILTSSNPSESIDEIINFPSDCLLTFRHDPSLDVTFNDVAVNAGNLHLYAPSLTCLGAKFGFIQLGTRQTNPGELFQQNFIDQFN